MELFPHQVKILKDTEKFNRCAYYVDLGLGKTFIGSEKLKQLNSDYNLVVCQKSKLKDWTEHFGTLYPEYTTFIYKGQEIPEKSVVIINYDSVWRKEEFLKLKDFTLLLDESQYVKNSKAKRSKFILKLKPKNVILLSGTPCAGRYEELLTQCKLLGWNITKEKYWDDYIISKDIDVGMNFPLKIITGYKNIEHLKEMLRQHGAIFTLAEEVITLPERIEIERRIDNIPQYKKFLKDKLTIIDGVSLLGNTTLSELLCLRRLAGQYNKNKIEYVKDILESSDTRFIIFYNFKDELKILQNLAIELNRPISEVNGDKVDLENYNKASNSITLVQYQAGSSGINLQKSNKIIYFTPTLSADQYMQSKARIRRIGQNQTCFYYYMITDKSIEQKIYESLNNRKDYTLKLFEKGGTKNGGFHL